MMEPIVLRAEALKKRFGRVLALDGMDLVVKQGEIVALAGANGAGKSTALRTLLNIYRADGGHSQVLGVDSRRIGPRDLARIGYVAEDMELPWRLTVGQWFDFLRPLYPGWKEEEARELAGLFDLPTGARLGSLSRGMRMKAALAAALAPRPELLLLDEPFSGLDPCVCDQVIRGILSRMPGLTVLLCSHDLAEVETIADRVAWLQDGRILFEEPTQRMLERFRQVAIHWDEPPPETPVRPQGCLGFEWEGRSMRFVVPGYQAGITEEDLAGRYWNGAVTATPMRLREIAAALIGETRREPGSVS